MTAWINRGPRWGRIAIIVIVFSALGFGGWYVATDHKVATAKQTASPAPSAKAAEPAKPTEGAQAPKPVEGAKVAPAHTEEKQEATPPPPKKKAAPATGDRRGRVYPATTRSEEWQNWGAAPFAHTREEACRKAPEAIDGFVEMPAEVKAEFKQLLGVTCSGGKVTYLVAGQLLSGMWTGGKDPHVMHDVKVAELPVAVAPDGRAYRSNTVFESARALEWQVKRGRKIYKIFLPDVCFNWSYSIEEDQENCVTLTFNAPVNGFVRWGVATKDGKPLKPDACNAQREGATAPWDAWYGQCDTCRPAIGYIRSVVGEKADVPHKYLYQATTESRQTLRFSREIWNALVYICLERPDGTQSCGVYTGGDGAGSWKNRTEVIIPDELIVWEEGGKNCPN